MNIGENMQNLARLWIGSVSDYLVADMLVTLKIASGLFGPLEAQELGSVTSRTAALAFLLSLQLEVHKWLMRHPCG